MRGCPMIKEYLLQNWPLLLVLAAFAIALSITVFLDKKTIRRMYILIVGVFLLSIVVFRNIVMPAEQTTITGISTTIVT